MSKKRRPRMPDTTRRAAPGIPAQARPRGIAPFDPNAQYGDNTTLAKDLNGPATAATTFLPGTPIQPTPGLGDGHLGPRAYQYPIGGNITAAPRHDEPVSFADLRALAQNFDGIGMCLEVHNRIIQRLECRILPRTGVIPDGEDASAAKWTKPARQMQEWLEEGPNFLADGWDLHSWLSALNRDLCVIDAGVVYHRQTRGGGLLGLQLIDGATIQILDAVDGSLPTDGTPAYRQVLYGAPGIVMTREMLDYLQYNPRTDDKYGIAPVERVLVIVNQALRKQEFDLRRWTDGASPSGVLSTTQPQFANWTPDQLRIFQEQWNNILAGNSALRVRTQVVLPGWQFTKTEPEDVSTQFDRWLLNITASVFGVSMDELGFTETSNRSVGQSQEAATYRNAVKPRSDFLARYLTKVIRRYHGTPLAPRGRAISYPGAPTSSPGTWDGRYRLVWGGIEEPDDFSTKATAIGGLYDRGILTRLQAKRELKMTVEPGEHDTPAYRTVQGGMDGIVILDDIETARKGMAQSRDLKLQAQQAALEQQQNIDKQMEAQAKQQAKQDALDAQFGTDTELPDDREPPPTGGATPPPPAPPGETPPAAAASTDNSATGVNEATVAAQVDHLIAQARQKKAKAGQRMVVADDLRATYNADSHPRGANGKWIGTGGKDLSKIGGLRAEVALDRHESLKVAPYDAKYGRGAHAARQAALTAKAAAGAAKLTAAERSLLKAHVATLKQDLITLSIQAADHKPGSPAEKAIKREMYARVTAESLILQHLYREQPPTKRAQMPTEEPYADRDPDQPQWPARHPHPVSERRGTGLGGRDDDAVGRSHAAPVASPDATLGSGAGSPAGRARGVSDRNSADRSIQIEQGYSGGFGTSSGLAAISDPTAARDGAIRVRGTGSPGDSQPEHADPAVTRAEWKAYREKALKAVKAGQVVPAWQPVALPDHLFIFAQDALRRATTPEDVRAVFAEVHQAEQHPAACRCMVCGCGLPHDDHGMPFPVHLPSDSPQEWSPPWLTFFLPATLSQHLALPGGEPILDLHITLACLTGDEQEWADPARWERLTETVQRWASAHDPQVLRTNGLGRFTGDAATYPLYASVDCPTIQVFRADLVQALSEAGFMTDTTYGYTPHITLAYLPQGMPLPDVRIPDITATLSHLWCCIGDRRFAYHLGGRDQRVALPDLDMLKVDIARSLKADLLRDLEY